MKRLLLCGYVLAALAAFGQNQIKVTLPCEYRSQQISPSGKHVAVRCKDRSVHLLRLPGGEEIASFPAKHRYENFDFSHDGQWFGAAGSHGNVEVISLSTPSSRKQWQVGATTFDILKFVSKNIVAISPHAAPGELWDISAEPVRKANLETDFDGLTAAAASPDAQWLVTTGADTVVRIYHAPEWKLSGEYRGLTLEPFAVAFTPDSKIAVIGGADRQITLLDAVSAKVIRVLPSAPDPIEQIYVLDSNRLAVLYFDADGRKPRHMAVWDVATGTSSPVAMDSAVNGGGIVDGRIWLARGDGNTLAFTMGQ
jgi:WD40 repeat protein